MRSTFRVLFYLKRNAPRKNGLVPVMVRITINGAIAQFSSKLDVDPAQWDIARRRVSGKSSQAQEINRQLDHIQFKIHQHYQEVYDRDGFITAEKVKNAYLGFDIRDQTLLQVFGRHNEGFIRQVGKIKSRATYMKYRCVYDHLVAFLHYRYRRKDINLKEITPSFITEFELFLRTEKNCSTNTVWIYMMPLRRMISIALNNGWIARNPFAEYRLSPESADRGFLTLEEIKTLMNPLPRKTLERVRDLFLFCCFTGLSYRDLKNLTKHNLQTSFDGNLWLITKRQKTGVASNIRLLEIPLKILEKYKKELHAGEALFRVPAYSSVRTMLKEIAERCGIEKNVTWHMARHTYATVICLTNGVPIETVSAMLGHRNIRTTQIYAKITNEKVSNDMEALSKRLRPIEQFLNNR